MSNEFKAGDLALLVKSTYGVNLGKVVELIRFDDSEIIRIPEEGERCFTSNPERLACWVVQGEFSADSTLRGLIDCKVAACPQSWLMPLRGDFTHEQQKTKEVIA